MLTIVSAIQNSKIKFLSTGAILTDYLLEEEQLLMFYDIAKDRV